MLAPRVALLRPILVNKLETTPSNSFRFWSVRSQTHSFSFVSRNFQTTSSEYRIAHRIYGSVAPYTNIPGGPSQKSSCEARSFGLTSRHVFHRLNSSATSRSISSAMSSTVAGSAPPSENSTDYSYLKQAEAQAIDDELMGNLGFSIDQLMVHYIEQNSRYNAQGLVLVSCHTCLYIASPSTK